MAKQNITGITDYFSPTDDMTPLNQESCFDWCLQQQIVHSNNLELWAMFLPLLSFIMHILYFWSFEIEALRKYQKGFIYLSRLFLIAFFAAYILIIRMRIIY